MGKICAWLAIAALIAGGCTNQVDAGAGGSAGGEAAQGGSAGSVALGGQGGAGGGSVQGNGGTSQGSGGGGGDDDGLNGCHIGSEDCSDACHLVDCCATELDLAAECLSRCEASLWVEDHHINCLALRIFWIDEEGCESIVQTYQAFQADDDCSGSMEP